MGLGEFECSNSQACTRLLVYYMDTVDDINRALP